MFLFCFWCPKCEHNGGFLTGIILLNQCYYHRGYKEILYLQPMIPPKRFGDAQKI